MLNASVFENCDQIATSFYLILLYSISMINIPRDEKLSLIRADSWERFIELPERDQLVVYDATKALVHYGGGKISLPAALDVWYAVGKYLNGRNLVVQPESE